MENTQKLKNKYFRRKDKMKFILRFFLFSTVMAKNSRTLQENTITAELNDDTCSVHNDNFQIFVQCLKENNNEYSICKKLFEEIDWEEWLYNDCYYVLKLPRN